VRRLLEGVLVPGAAPLVRGAISEPARGRAQFTRPGGRERSGDADVGGLCRSGRGDREPRGPEALPPGAGSFSGRSGVDRSLGAVLRCRATGGFMAKTVRIFGKDT
jgi:hypothetical protein